MSEKAPAVTVESVSKVFGSGNDLVYALDEISLEIRDKEFVTIIGPSGCGKTTLLRTIAHLETPTSGSVRVMGKTPEQARLDRDFAVVFQSPALLEWRNTLQNVVLPLEILGRAKDEGLEKAQSLIELVGLAGFEKALPRQLSGGMQQRVALARALTLDPTVLLMDEPFGALDQITRERMNMELLGIWHQQKVTVVFITHNIREAVLLSDRIVVFTCRPGRIQGIIEVNLPRPRTRAIAETEAFVALQLEGEKLLAGGMQNGS
jgi:NitT/TauT family transport system ATP-binding protein